MNEKISGIIKLYTKFEGSIHGFYRSWWSRSYSLGQLRDAKKVYPNWKPLTKAQKKEIAAYWRLRHPASSDFITHEIMMNVKGDFDVRYVPEKIFRYYLDPALSNRHILQAWDDKNYFERHQPDLPFPHTYVRNVNGYFMDHDYHLIKKEEARSIILQNLPVIIKPSLLSGEGKSLKLITTEQQANEIFTQYDKDYIVQALVTQCDELKQMSHRSVCSMRLITAMVNGEVKLIKKHLLCNTQDTIAVNAVVDSAGLPSAGTVLIGIDEEGRLFDTGYYENAQKLQSMPWDFKFDGMQIPAFKEAVRMAIKAHESMPMLGVIGWDVTIDDNNKPVFFEWNLRGIEIYHSQLTQGPLFGEYSDYFADKVGEIIKRGYVDDGYAV